MSISRRRFLQLSAGAGAGFLLGGCAGPVRRDPNPEFLALGTERAGSVSLAVKTDQA